MRLINIHYLSFPLLIFILFSVKIDEPLKDASDLMVKTNHTVNNIEHEAQFSEDEDDIPLGIFLHGFSKVFWLLVQNILFVFIYSQ